MKYLDIEPTVSRRFRLPESHPVLAEITISTFDLHRFEQLDENHPETKIVGRDEPEDGMITVFVACASGEVADRLEDGWA
jgi:hypothetical protein